MTDEQHKLVEDNMRLVHHLVRTCFYVTKPDVYDEYVAVGNMYLCLAASRYDDTKSKFATYASSYIIGGIKTYINTLNDNIRIPRRVVKAWGIMCDTCADPRDPSNDEILDILSKHSDISESDIQTAIDLKCCVRLDDEIVNSADSSASDRYEVLFDVTNKQDLYEDFCFTESFKQFLEEELSDKYKYTETRSLVVREAINQAYTRGYVDTVQLGRITGISQSYCSRIISAFKKELKRWLDEE